MGDPPANSVWLVGWRVYRGRAWRRQGAPASCGCRQDIANFDSSIRIRRIAGRVSEVAHAGDERARAELLHGFSTRSGEALPDAPIKGCEAQWSKYCLS
jgi:hypothetical protein